jgi:hypothetical protein
MNRPCNYIYKATFWDYCTNKYNPIGKIISCKNRYKTITWDNCRIMYKLKDGNIFVQIRTKYFLGIIVQLHTILLSMVLL